MAENLGTKLGGFFYERLSRPKVAICSTEPWLEIGSISAEALPLEDGSKISSMTGLTIYQAVDRTTLVKGIPWGVIQVHDFSYVSVEDCYYAVRLSTVPVTTSAELKATISEFEQMTEGFCRDGHDQSVAQWLEIRLNPKVPAKFLNSGLHLPRPGYIANLRSK